MELHLDIIKMKTTLILTVVGATVAQVPQELTSMPACAVSRVKTSLIGPIPCPLLVANMTDRITDD